MPAAYQMFVQRRILGWVSAARAVRSIVVIALASRVLAGLRQIGAAAMAGLLGITLLPACSVESDCENEACVCAEGATCDFDCVAPPCHVECREHSDCTGQCANGECACASDAVCTFGCDAPPCHVNCANDSNCGGTCANGSCNCGAGSDCQFECQSGPCHVSCGAGSACSGECSNGTCSCGNDGKCSFTCKDNNCKTICPSGAECLLTCPNGNAGEGNCKFDTCSGGVMECADGKTLACNRACP